MIKAVIFDMDGVLIDSEKIHMKAWQKVFKDKFNKKVKDKEFVSFFGTTDINTAKGLMKLTGVKAKLSDLREAKKRLYLEESMKMVKLFPGAKQLVKKLSKKYKVALVSTEWKGTIIKEMKKFRMKEYFKIILGKEDVKKHKPDPQPYLAACKKLRVKPSEAVVVEDSISGVESATRAKCKCIAVATSYPKSKLKKADLIVDSIKNIKI